MRVTAFAPATVANVFVGFDIFGFSIDQIGDIITLEPAEDGITEILQISGTTTSIPKELEKNTAGKAIQHLLKTVDSDLDVKITIEKGIPLASGLGGSAASAVAAVVAVAELLDSKYTQELLFESA